MPRVFSGIQPTGDPHLGNWLGAISRWAAGQEQGHVFCIVDLHAITIPKEPGEVRAKTLDLAMWLFAAGLDPTVADGVRAVPGTRAHRTGMDPCLHHPDG